MQEPRRVTIIIIIVLFGGAGYKKRLEKNVTQTGVTTKKNKSSLKGRERFTPFYYAPV